jgi:Helix-turn-helix domain/RodZ C-terminal domain
MEEENWELLPGSAYARAFLRTYAEYLDLDADAILEQYDGAEESREPEPAGEPVRQIAIDDRPGRERRPADGGRVRWAIGAVAAAAVLGVLLVLGLTGGDEEGGGGRETRAGSGSGKESAAGSKPERSSPAPPPSAVVRLTATGSVWVCLVNANGQALVDSVTLTAGQEEGPFKGDSFDVTFGNGQVEMEANDKPVSIPPAANPLGYRVTPDGTRELDPSARPTCA